MINLLKQQGGVLFPGGKRLELESIRPLNLGYLHAEAEAKQNGNTLRVAISFGPQHGAGDRPPGAEQAGQPSGPAILRCGAPGMLQSHHPRTPASDPPLEARQLL